jgi:hypothetical protein
MKRTGKKRLLTLAAVLALTAVMPMSAFAEQGAGSGAYSSSGRTPLADQAASAAQADTEATPVKAAITKEKAAELARTAFKIPKEYTLQNASLNTGMLANGKRSIWNLSFIKKVNGKQKGSIDAGIEAQSGEPLSYSVYEDNPGYKPSYPPKVDREKAEALALTFSKQISPDYADKVAFDPEFGLQMRPPLNGEVSHSLRFNRIVNGISYTDNYIEAEIDGDGRVTRYNVNWDNTLTFENVKPGLTLEQATAKFKALASPALNYLIPYQAEERKPYLAYSLVPFMLDAVTGEKWNPLQSATAPNTTTSVSDKPLAAPPAGGLSLTAQQAADIVKKAFPVPAEATLTESNYSEWTDDRSDKVTANWNLGWSAKRNGHDEQVVWASVDSGTGVIKNYSGYGLTESLLQAGAKEATYEQAKSKAIDTVKKLVPHLADQLYVQDMNKADYEGKKPADIHEYYFRFQRIVHGAVVSYDNLTVSISALTGEVSNYYGEMSDFAYPSVKPAVISRDKAVQAWMNYYKVELTYASNIQLNGQPIPLEKYNVMVAAGDIPPGGFQGSEAKLVYRLAARPVDEPVFLDAATGQWREQSTGQPTELVKPKAADIEGHWAQRELELMVAYKALDLKDGKVRPNAVITRGELIKMLVLAMNSGRQPMYGVADQAGSTASASFKDVSADSTFFVYVEAALQQNLIDRGDGSFNPTGKVDREEMAELIVRALGYNSLAEHNEMFKSDFTDAAATEQKGQAAIVVGLKIMSLVGGKFEPAREVTRAEASAAFFRYLQARADLKEAPIRE